MVLVHLPEVVFKHTMPPRVGQVVYRVVGDDKRLEVLLVRSFTPGYDIGLCIPKGKLEPNEKDEDGAAREVKEETGLTTKIVGDLGETPYHSSRMHIYLGKYESGGLDAKGNALDHDFENDVVKFYDWDWAVQNIRPTYKHWLDKALPKIKEMENGN